MAIHALAGLGVRGLLSRAITTLSSAGSRLMTASGPTLEKIAKRVGTQANPQAIINAIKNNKLATAYVLYELYGVTDDILTAMREVDEEVARVVALFGFQPDEPSTTAVADLSTMTEEFEVLSSAIRVVGSFERLLVLKKALTLSDATYVYYRSVKDLGRSLS